jgi:hypothetical protein
MIGFAVPEAQRRLNQGGTMDDELPDLSSPVRGRPFEKGRSGNPAGRRGGSRNRATLAAAVLVEAEALTRKAVELALDGDPVALRLCIERILPPCRERPVRLALPPIESAGDVSGAMNAVTSALARGTLTPGEAERIAIVVETFARAIDTTKRRAFAANPLQILGFGNFDEIDDCNSDEGGAGNSQDADHYDPERAGVTIKARSAGRSPLAPLTERLRSMGLRADTGQGVEACFRIACFHNWKRPLSPTLSRRTGRGVRCSEDRRSLPVARVWVRR